ncbi:MAG: hypothetical protein OH319_03730 [Candidatus Parvarchaeota archaeon]|nr:hypothetical protein [Candidatus Jingweiarchaeum tengchongense]MCW1298591.1 hypothetical protein [Candidatus Jingweiarchaeum tengchongense]MCW1300437.1 hypothetical protein [Candidatus Jingweiarchaeum tengchongense]MCW1304615.1 hypothetical protein [Candidatus Jingweiarchaeum tengchongense]MCW1310286.1 hypothetical protein [Candidatus Jingweiarchaeum tengchongense]
MNEKKMEIFTYEELRKIQQKEREEGKLQKLEKDFLEKLVNYLKEKKEMLAEKEKDENVFSRDMRIKLKNELENASKIIMDIYERRERKILNEAIIASRMQHEIPDYSRMLDFEEKLFNEVLEILKKYRKEILEKTLKGENIREEGQTVDKDITKKEETTEKHELKEPELGNTKLIKITSTVPSFIWTDGKTYGPFEKEDVVNIDKEIAEILLNTGKAIEIKVIE